MASFEIKSYGAHQSSGTAYSGHIYLWGATRHIGNAYFMKAGDSVLTPTQDAAGFISLYYPHWAFPFIVDLLRNEKPCYVTWGTSAGTIGTSAEAVGEEEAAAP